MPSKEDIPPVYVQPKRWLAFLLALLFFYLGAIAASQPFLTFFPQLVGEEVTAKELLAYRVVGFVVFLPIGILCFVCVGKFLVLMVRGYCLVADERGLYLNTDLVSYGTIPWKMITDMTCSGKSRKTLTIRFQPNAVSHSLNFWCRVCSRRRHSETRRLLVRFTFCKGNSDEISEQVVGQWRSYTEQKQA